MNVLANHLGSGVITVQGIMAFVNHRPGLETVILNEENEKTQRLPSDPAAKNHGLLPAQTEQNSVL